MLYRTAVRKRSGREKQKKLDTRDGCFFDRDFACAEPFRRALLRLHDERSFVINPKGNAVEMARTLNERNGFAAKEIVLIPSLREIALVVASHELLIGIEHAADQGSGELIEVHRGI